MGKHEICMATMHSQESWLRRNKAENMLIYSVMMTFAPEGNLSNAIEILSQVKYQTGLVKHPDQKGEKPN